MTQFVLALSEHVWYFWLVIGCLVAAIFGINAILRSSAEGRRIRESIILHIPAFGPLYHSSILSKMAEAMAMMVAAGCDMPTCLRLGADATGSETLTKEGDIIAGQIEKGAGILDAGQFCRVIPRFFLYSIQLGSQRNELQDNLRSLGDMYAQQVRSATDPPAGVAAACYDYFCGLFHNDVHSCDVSANDKNNFNSECWDDWIMLIALAIVLLLVIGHACLFQAGSGIYRRHCAQRGYGGIWCCIRIE